MILVVVHGAVAQLVAHLHGMQGVRGSSPLSSTRGRARSSDRALSLCGVRSVCSALGVECARCGVHHVECAMWSALRRDDASSPCHVSPLVLTRAPSPRSRIRGPPEDRAACSLQLAACSLPLAVRCLPPAVRRPLLAASVAGFGADGADCGWPVSRLARSALRRLLRGARRVHRLEECLPGGAGSTRTPSTSSGRSR